MDRPPEPTPREEPWDEVELDEQFVDSAAYTEAPGLERIATARWSAHREPLAEPAAGVPAIGVHPRRRHLAARAGGAGLAVAVLLAGGYVAARDAHVAMPSVTLLMGSGGGHQPQAQHKMARTTTARPLTPAGTDSETPSDQGAGTSLGPAATGGSEQPPTAEPSVTATAPDTPAAQALPTLAVGASGSPVPTPAGAAPSASSTAGTQSGAEATASPDDSPSPSATPSDSPTPSASPSGTPAPMPSPRLP